MCGICGVVGREDEQLVRDMADTLAHRGPDGEGFRCFPARNGGAPASLGHRRLTIIDLTERGAQPMEYADGRYWIVYNGELYNFKELRTDLEQDGYRFRSECDTEVLLAAYCKYGKAMLERLNGIFAFAIWDTERHELFLARDRLGVKPLYYTQHDGLFYFASEIKALLKVLPTPRLRPEGIADYLTFLWIPDPDTMFEGIFKLPAGHFAEFGRGQLQIRPYWDLVFDVDDSLSEGDWISSVERFVREAVRRQMVSDAPLGSFLSGGIDSSAIVAQMTAAAGDVTAYSIGFSAQDLSYDISPDDLRYARSVAKTFGVDYHEQLLEPRIVDLLPRLVRHLDDPIADPAAVTTYLICSAASERLKVILSGMGGDEVFAGYPRYPAARIAGLADAIPARLRRAMRTASEGRLTLGPPGRLRPLRRNLMKLLRGIDQPPQDRYLVYCSYYRPEELQVLRPGARPAVAQSDAVRRREDVSPLSEPCLYGQDEHGSVHRGAGPAARRRGRVARCANTPASQASPPDAKVRVQTEHGRDPSARCDLAAKGGVRRADSRLARQRAEADDRRRPLPGSRRGSGSVRSDRSATAGLRYRRRHGRQRASPLGAADTRTVAPRIRRSRDGGELNLRGSPEAARRTCALDDHPRQVIGDVRLTVKRS